MLKVRVENLGDTGREETKSQEKLVTTPLPGYEIGVLVLLKPKLASLLWSFGYSVSIIKSVY